jgi:hypothetical protein
MYQLLFKEVQRGDAFRCLGLPGTLMLKIDGNKAAFEYKGREFTKVFSPDAVCLQYPTDND